MKRRNINKNDATTNMELKTLAKAFVESAVNEGYTALFTHTTGMAGNNS